jgi:phosphate uptake regulator
MGKEEQVTIKLKIPQEWTKKLNKIAEENYRTSEEMIMAIVAEYLNVSYEDILLQNLSEKVEKIERRLSKIEEKDYNLDKLVNRLTIMEKLMTSLQTRQIVTTAEIPLNSELEDDEDIYDEPDEILTDFL